MTELMQASLTAIGCQLQARPLADLAKAAAQELRSDRSVVASNWQAADDRLARVLQSAIADPGPRRSPNRATRPPHRVNRSLSPVRFDAMTTFAD